MCMVKESKLATAAHFASIGQFVLAVPCLALAWMAYWHPSSSASGPPVAPLSSAWPSMLTPPVLLPIAVAVLSACVVLAGILNFLASRRHVHLTPQELEAKLAEMRLEVEKQIPSIMVNGELVAGPDPVARPASTLSPFSPIQLEAFELAKDILHLLEEMGKRPEPDREQYSYNPAQHRFTDKDQLEAYFDAKRKLQQPWILKGESIWRRDFERRLEEIIPKFGIEGLDVTGLRSTNERILRGFFPTYAVFDVAKDLIYAAHALDTRKVTPLLDEVPK